MKNPIYILAAAPNKTTKLEKFFESGEESIMFLLQHPGSIRYAGWDMQTLDTPRIIKGEYLEVQNGDRKIIKLYEDGTLIVRALADNTFLGWGQDQELFLENPRLNPIALVEFTYNFVDFYRKIAEYFTERPESIKFKIELNNAFLEKARLYLTPYAVGTYAWHFNNDKHEAPENKKIWEVDIPINHLIESPTFAAYALVEKVYLWFGLEPKEIPYATEDQSGKRFIDIERIKKSS